MPGASGPGRADRRRRLAGATVVALVASFAMTVAALPASAQVRRDSLGSITGTVVSSVNGEVLPRAQVSITGTTRGTITDDAGRFTITGLPEGTITLTARALGYQIGRAHV